MEAVLSSPNKWLEKIGSHISSEGKLNLPMPFLLINLTQSSEEIERYSLANELGEKIRLIKSIALNVRQAETTYFNEWSESIKIKNKDKQNKIFPCLDCFYTTISPNSLRKTVSSSLDKCRSQVNDKIIHANENGYLLTPREFELVSNYYYSFLKLNLFYFETIQNLPIKNCKIHKTE